MVGVSPSQFTHQAHRKETQTCLVTRNIQTPNMSSTVIAIPSGDRDGIVVPTRNNTKSRFSSVYSLVEKKWKEEFESIRKVIHSVKVGMALVLVSLLYLLDPFYKTVGDNAMWAIMTVVVVFEFTAGATLSKGINRGIGTILGGGLGCLAAILADEIGGIGHAISVGISVFIFGAAATYSRLVPSVKRRYDYGAVIFLLTFNLVAVSGLRANKVMELARDRLSTIGMGFAVCIIISLLVFPVWASDELHYSTASKFNKLASCIEGLLEEYFMIADEKPIFNADSCKSVLHFKSNEEALANFARWEPWHGKFGFSYPWHKYLQIGEALRELAAIVLSLKVNLRSPRQASLKQRELIKEQCEMVGLSLTWTMRELGESIKTMKKSRTKVIVSKLHSTKLELSLLLASSSEIPAKENGEGLTVASSVFLLMDIVEKVEDLAKEVDELGELAGFQTK